MPPVTKEDIREHVEENHDYMRPRVAQSRLARELDIHYMGSNKDLTCALESLYQDGFLEATFRLRCRGCGSSMSPHYNTRAEARIAKDHHWECMNCWREVRRNDMEVVPAFFVEIPDTIEDSLVEIHDE